jgi:deoxyribonuclease V
MMPIPPLCAIACLDVAYSSTAAAVACVMIQSWDAKGANRIQVRRFDSPSERYEPGAFYKRELPLLMSIISEFEDAIEVIVIDGYVWLDANSQPGLGGTSSRAWDAVSLSLASRKRGI